jgi:hypothetical protein
MSQNTLRTLAGRNRGQRAFGKAEKKEEEKNEKNARKFRCARKVATYITWQRTTVFLNRYSEANISIICVSPIVRSNVNSSPEAGKSKIIFLIKNKFKKVCPHVPRVAPAQGTWPALARAHQSSVSATTCAPAHRAPSPPPWPAAARCCAWCTPTWRRG